MRRLTTTLSLLTVAGIALAACGGDAADDTDAAAPTTEAMTEEMESEPMDDMTSEAMDEEMAMAGPVGPGCAAFAEQVPDGEGSVEGMTDDPVAVAASNNPLLTTLTAAVSGQLNPEVDLVDTLNCAEFTVFAPVDDAFAALDPATVETLGTDADLLSTILTYHVVPGQISPDEIAGTTQTTVQGDTVEVAGEADMLTVNGANVICGGVTTANATVYLIDGVLTPPAAG